jgi:hypothetical protein
VENLPLLTHFPSLTEELKLELSFPREIGYGQLSGAFQDTMSTDNGLLVVKSISCKVEEMLTIQENSEEDLKLSAQLCIGDLTSSPINTLKLMLRNQAQVDLLLTSSILSASIGIRIPFIHILIPIPTKFFKLITHPKAIGTSQVLLTDQILGNTPRTKMLLSIDLTI